MACLSIGLLFQEAQQGDAHAGLPEFLDMVGYAGQAFFTVGQSLKEIAYAVGQFYKMFDIVQEALPLPRHSWWLYTVNKLPRAKPASSTFSLLARSMAQEVGAESGRESCRERVCQY